MQLPPLRIGDLVARIPILQGGMAIRISTGSLAGAVAATGAVGIIGASGMTFDELAEEISIARKKALDGLIGINIMYAAKEFLGIVHTAIKEKIDFIVSGAGFSRDLFQIGKKFNVPIIPIVSSAKFARLAEKIGAAAIIVEGKEAGGHLGTDRPLMEILPEIIKAVKLPVIAAGGIFDGKGIVDAFNMGAQGVQLATKFVFAEECNASPAYKKMYQKAKKEDVSLIESPVGLPGRALRNPFVEKILNSKAPSPAACDYCLKNCSLKYCIFDALKNSQKGNVDEGVVFCGENVYKIKDRSIKPAAQIIKELVQEVENL